MGKPAVITAGATVDEFAERDAPTLTRELADAVGWISTAALAKLLGRTSPRAARDWCKRHALEVRRDGKLNFVRLADVRRALDGLPVANDAPEPARLARARDAAVAAALAQLGGGKV